MRLSNRLFGSSNNPRRGHAAVARATSLVMESMEQRQLMSAVPVTTSSLIYTQNFSADTVPNGWVLKEVGTSGAVNQQAAVGNGSSNAGDTYLFGASSADRAFGTLLSGTNTPTIGAVFRNDTGQLITQASIKYNGEMWRLGQANRGADALNFGYRVVSGAEPTDPTSGPFTAVPALNFNSPVTTGTAGALNGNVAPNRTDNITSALPGLSWAPGAYLMIQWTDFNVSGSDDGLAVDDFNLTVSGITAGGPGAITIDPSSKTVNENAGTVSFTVNRVGGTVGSISADILMDDVTAVAGDDYGQPSLNTVSFADGSSTAQTITIPIVDDTKYELSEQFTVGLTNAQGSNGAPSLGSPATVTINDNDTAYYSQSFEGAPGTGYTLIGDTGDYVVPPPSGVGSTIYAYFGRFASPDTVAVGRKDFTSGFDGGFAIHGQNHSADAFGNGANPVRTVEIDPINIQGRQDLSAYFSLGADSAEPAFQDWNNTDGISIYATIDSGERVLIGQFRPSNIKGDLKLDTNLDGVGDGVTLHAGALQDFAFNVPGTGSSLKLDVEVTSTAGFQAWTVDNVRVDGTQAATGLPTWVSPGSAATWDAASHTLAVTGATTIIADPAADTANIVASGAAAVISIVPATDQRIHLAGLTLTGGASASLDSVGASRSGTNHRLLVIPASALSIDGTSTLNLHDNDLVVKSAADVSVVRSLIAAGRLTSNADNFSTALAYGMNDGSGFFQYDHFGPGTGSANQEAVAAGDLLVKFTFAGDGNLDGRVDSDDLFYIDFNLGNTSNSSWTSGDFNADGRTDTDDLFFIDFNLGQQGM